MRKARATSQHAYSVLTDKQQNTETGLAYALAKRLERRVSSNDPCGRWNRLWRPGSLGRNHHSCRQLKVCAENHYERRRKASDRSALSQHFSLGSVPRFSVRVRERA